MPEAVEIVRTLLASVDGTIGVIGPPARQSSLAAALASADLAGADRVVVVTPLQAKGLEYDAVLVVGPDEIVAESAGRDPDPLRGADSADPAAGHAGRAAAARMGIS